MEQEDNPAQRHQAQRLCAASCGQSRINSLRRRNESCHKRALSSCGCELACGSRRIRPENGLSWSCSLQRAARSRCPVFAKQSILIPAVQPPPPSAPGPIPPTPNIASFSPAGWCNWTLSTRSIPPERYACTMTEGKLAALPHLPYYEEFPW